MNKTTLGRLEKVNVRSVWPDEARDFTPWLAQPENISLLGTAIDLDLEVESQEAAVGPFRADILCKDTTTGHYVLVENQLERTDHLHLGQLLTYAAGLDAVTVVWVAAQFTDEHRAALDWLNRITNENINFFGLEIEIWHIGESAYAPKFSFSSKPNDWQKKATTAAASAASGPRTEFEQRHMEFWTELRQYLIDCESPIRIPKSSKDSWTQVALGRSEFALTLTNGMRDNNSSIYLSITGRFAKSYFHLLHDNFKNTIETKLGPVEWRELPENKESQIRLVRRSTPSDPSTWPELKDWMKSKAECWTQTLKPIIQELDASRFNPSSSDSNADADGAGAASP